MADEDKVRDLNRERFNRVDAKLDRVLEKLDTLTERVGNLELGLARLARALITKAMAEHNKGFGPVRGLTPVDISLEDDRIARRKRNRIGLAARLAMCDFGVPLSDEEQAEQHAWDKTPPKGDEVI